MTKFMMTNRCLSVIIVRARKDLNDKLSKEGLKLSLNDFVIKAAALVSRYSQGAASASDRKLIPGHQQCSSC